MSRWKRWLASQPETVANAAVRRLMVVPIVSPVHARIELRAREGRMRAKYGRNPTPETIRSINEMSKENG